MATSVLIVLSCVIILTGVVVYFPVIYIRKTDKILKALEEIAANSKKA